MEQLLQAEMMASECLNRSRDPIRPGQTQTSTAIVASRKIARSLRRLNY